MPLIATFFNISALSAAWWFLLVQVVVGWVVSVSAFLTIAKTFLGKVIVIFALSALTVVAWLISDVYITYFFTVSFFPWLLVLLERKYYKTLFAYVFLLGIIVEYGNFVRSFSGLPLLVGSIVTLGCFLKLSRKAFLYFFIIFLAIGFVRLHIHMVIKQRDTYLKSQGYTFEKEKLEHTFWHNVYMGFGFITNNKNITFSDSCSMERVKNINPHAEYLKPEYEATLRNEVIKLCIFSPNFVLRVLFAKLGVLFYYLLLFANIGLLFAYYHPKSWYVEISYWSMFAISALPGILTIPTILYLLGFVSIAVFYGIHSLLYALDR